MRRRYVLKLIGDGVLGCSPNEDRAAADAPHCGRASFPPKTWPVLNARRAASIG